MRLVVPVTLFLLASVLSVASAQEAALGSPWQADASDNICGVTSLRQVTNPAKLDYRAVLAATPEMKDLKRRGIAEGSAEGQILRQRAVDHVRRLGSQVMRKNGHCSLWKDISHRDGRRIRDLSTDVIAALSLSRTSFGKGGVSVDELLSADEPAAVSGGTESPEGEGSQSFILLIIGCGVVALLGVLLRTRAAEDITPS
jgi:hypothetical protein